MRDTESLAKQFGELKFKYRNREFWCRGYYVDTVGKNTAKIREYISRQLEEDKLGEQLSIPYPGSPLRAASKRTSRCQAVVRLLGRSWKKALQAHKKPHRLGRWGFLCQCEKLF